jgi:hypothetical protein
MRRTQVGGIKSVGEAAQSINDQWLETVRSGFGMTGNGSYIAKVKIESNTAQANTWLERIFKEIGGNLPTETSSSVNIKNNLPINGPTPPLLTLQDPNIMNSVSIEKKRRYSVGMENEVFLGNTNLSQNDFGLKTPILTDTPFVPMPQTPYAPTSDLSLLYKESKKPYIPINSNAPVFNANLSTRQPEQKTESSLNVKGDINLTIDGRLIEGDSPEKREQSILELIAQTVQNNPEIKKLAERIANTESKLKISPPPPASPTFPNVYLNNPNSPTISPR